MENVEFTKPNASQKFKQGDLPFGGIEKKEKNDIKWKITVGDGNRDSSGDEGLLYLAYDNGKCTIDGEEVPFEAFKFEIGPHQQFFEKDDSDTFKKILEIEEGKK